MVNPIGYNPIFTGALGIADPWRPSLQTAGGLFGMASPSFPFIAQGLGGMNSLFTIPMASTMAYPLLAGSAQMASASVFAGTMQLALGFLGFGPQAPVAPAPAIPVQAPAPQMIAAAEPEAPKEKPKKEVEKERPEPPVRPLSRAARRAAARAAKAEKAEASRKEAAERQTFAKKRALDKAVVQGLESRARVVNAQYNRPDPLKPHHLKVTMKAGETPQDVVDTIAAVVRGADNSVSRKIKDLPEKWVPVTVTVEVPKDQSPAVQRELARIRPSDTNFIRPTILIEEYS